MPEVLAPDQQAVTSSGGDSQYLMDERLRNWLNPLLAAGTTHIMQKQMIWNRLEQLWRSYRFGKPFPWRANIFNPISFFLVETVLPQMVLTTFQDVQKVFGVLPTEDGDLDTARLEEHLLNYQTLVEMQPLLQ